MGIEYGTDWRVVSETEFEAFLRRYPRPLTIDPPPAQRARFRCYLDPTLGAGPDSQVASVHHAHRSAIYVIRTDATPCSAATSS
jgi:hypothetical protein